jgi:hypothetical protein
MLQQTVLQDIEAGMAEVLRNYSERVGLHIRRNNFFFVNLFQAVSTVSPSSIFNVFECFELHIMHMQHLRSIHQSYALIEAHYKPDMSDIYMPH